LSLFVDLPLNLEFDFAEFFFLPAELLFLETHALGSKLLGKDRCVTTEVAAI
jgi:hypothetical protein